MGSCSHPGWRLSLFTVQALWSRQHALHLWVAPAGDPTDVAGVPDLSDLEKQCPALAAALQSPARGSLTVLAPGPDAGWRPVLVRSVALFPTRAWPVLDEVAQWAASGEEGGGGDPGVVLGDTLLYIAHVAAAVSQWVETGQVAPLLDVGSEDAWARWEPLPSAAVDNWLAQAAAAMPPLLRTQDATWEAPLVVPGQRRDDGAEAPVPRGGGAIAASATPAPASGRPAREVLDDLVRELTDARIRSLLAALPPGHTPARTPLLAWVHALETGEPVTDDGGRPWPPAQLHQLSTQIEKWRASTYRAPWELLLRLAEASTPATARATGHLGDRVQEAWELQLWLRSLDDPSLVINPGATAQLPGAPSDPAGLLVAELARAGQAFAPLLDWCAGLARAAVGLTGEQVLTFVQHGAPALAAAGVAVEVPAAWAKAELSLRLTAGPGAQDASRGDGLGLLGLDALVDFGWQAALGDQVLTAAELEALADAKSPLVKIRGQWVQVDPEILKRTAAFLEQGPTHGKVRDLIDLMSGRAELPLQVGHVDAQGWIAELLSLSAGAEGHDDGGTAVLRMAPAPAGLEATLRPYQRRGLAWLDFMAQRGIGVILADDMGLGKTVQLLALEQTEHEGGRGGGPTLVVCPMSVVGNWQREAARFTPGLHSYVHHGAGRATPDRLAGVAAVHDLVLTTYATAARDQAALAQVPWRRIVLDEAQHVKNPATRQARAVRSLQAHHRVALTGTPVENRLEELRALLDFANPGMLGSVKGFRSRFSVPVERHHDPDAAARLRAVTSPFILRREKTDPEVISDLPEKMEFTVLANLTTEQASLYQAVVRDLMDGVGKVAGIQRRGLVLASLTKLKQICNHPAHFLGDGSPVVRRGVHRSGKMALLDDLLESIFSDGERVLCFTQYREFGKLIAPYIAARFDMEVPFLHGGLSKSKREAMVDQFQSETGPGILLLSLKAGGTGLNLTAASQVIHLDRWWNPAVEDQATDRAYRIGQTRRVQVRKVVCVGTLEERIDAMIQAKRTLADQIVAASENWVTELGDEELAELVALSRDSVGE